MNSFSEFDSKSSKVRKYQGKNNKGKIVNEFSDGYSITLDFKLNDQQIEVINQIDEFVNNQNERAMTISGWAGTGKTTMMQIVADRYWFGHKIHFCATTHKAAGVLRAKTGKPVSTVNSLFGINVEIDMDGDVFDASKKKNVLATEKLNDNSIAIIDEASMLSEANYNEVIECCSIHNAKVIFIGDAAQLAPVNENDISIVFRNNDNRIVELNKVERTNDNSILKEATAIRLGGGFSYESNGNVEYINTNDKSGIAGIFDTYIPGLKEDPNYFRILTYTNKSVEKLNTVTRKKLGYDGMNPQPGEPMMSYANWGYLCSYPVTQYEFINSEAYTVINVSEPRKVSVASMFPSGVPVEENHDLYAEICDMSLQDGLGEIHSVPYMDIKKNKNNYRIAKLLSYEKIAQWKRYKQCKDKFSKIECTKMVNAIEQFLFVNETIKDDNGYVLQQKVIDYGYAHTIHKSQGSTFKNVLINDLDVDNCDDNVTKRQLRYVALTRASDRVMIITNKSKA